MGTGETPGEQIVRRLTFERIEELKKSIKAQHALYKKLKQEAKLIAEGKLDHKLEQMWQEIQAEKRAANRGLGIQVESPTPPATGTTTVELKQQETESTKSTTQAVAVTALKPSDQQKRPEPSDKPKTETVPPGGTPMKQTDISTNASSHSIDAQTSIVVQKPEKTSKETHIETKPAVPSSQSDGCLTQPTETNATKPTQLTNEGKDGQANDPMETVDGNEIIFDDGSTIEDDDARRDSETDATISPEELSGEEATGDAVEEEGNEMESKEKMVAKKEGETKNTEVEEPTRNQVDESVKTKEETGMAEEKDNEKSEEVQPKHVETEEINDKTDHCQDESQIKNSQTEQNQETAVQIDTEADKEVTPICPGDNQPTEQSKPCSVSPPPSQLTSTPVTVTIHQVTSDNQPPIAVTKPEPSEFLLPKPSQGVISTITRPLILRPIPKTSVPSVSSPTSTLQTSPVPSLAHHATAVQVVPPVETKDVSVTPSLAPLISIPSSSPTLASHAQPVASEPDKPEMTSCDNQVSTETTNRPHVETKDDTPALPSEEAETSEEGKEIITVSVSCIGCGFVHLLIHDYMPFLMFVCLSLCMLCLGCS
jgi:hypothetical protein